MSTEMCLSKGLRPTIQWLRSVALLVLHSEDGEDFHVPAERLGEWLTRWDAHYKDLIGVSTGERVHLLYHRDLSIIGSELLTRTPRLLHLAELAAKCGMGMSLSIPLEEALDHQAEVRSLLESGDVTTFALSVERVNRDSAGAEVGELLNSIVESKAHIAFSGPYRVVKELGLLDNPHVAQSQITMHPASSEVDARIPELPVLSCSSRLRLYVDPEGDIYPCLGLVGLRSMSLGHIDQPLEETALGATPYPLDLDRLVHAGPELADNSPTVRHTGLPWACERHRFELMNGAAPTGE